MNSWYKDCAMRVGELCMTDWSGARSSVARKGGVAR